MRTVFAAYIAAPFLAISLGILYYAWTHDGTGAIWMVPFLVVACLIWVLSPQINWWWYRQHPPTLEPEMLAALERHCIFYQQLDQPAQKVFRGRVALTRMGTEWVSKNMVSEEVPVDVQTVIATQSVIASWGQKDFLFKDVEKVIVSPYAFLSPDFPQPHHIETFLPDQCMLVSAQAALGAFFEPVAYFNPVLYAYFQAAFRKYGRPALEVDTMRLKEVSGWNENTILAATGLPEIDWQAVAGVLFATLPELVAVKYPELSNIYNWVGSESPR